MRVLQIFQQIHSNPAPCRHVHSRPDCHAPRVIKITLKHTTIDAPDANKNRLEIAARYHVSLESTSEAISSADIDIPNYCEFQKRPRSFFNRMLFEQICDKYNCAIIAHCRWKRQGRLPTLRKLAENKQIVIDERESYENII